MVMSCLPSEHDWGGVSFHVHRLANVLATRGHSIDMFTLSDPPTDALYHTVRIGSRSEFASKLFRLYGFPLRVSRCDFTGYDLVHTHGDDHWLRSPVPVIRTFYGSALGEALSSKSLKRFASQVSIYPCEAISSLKASAAVGISRTTARHIPFLRQIIPCGVDCRQFRPGEKSLHPSILFVGTLHGRKRGKMLADLFTRVVRPTVKKAELWMVCERSDPMPGVRWLGKISTDVLTDLYRQAWVFCLPSLYEGFGIPYIEAMASGTPVIASPNPGAVEVLDRGRYGRIATDAHLAETLVELLRSAEDRIAMSDAGLQRASAYSFETIADQYESLYRTVLSRTTKGRKTGIR